MSSSDVASGGEIFTNQVVLGYGLFKVSVDATGDVFGDRVPQFADQAAVSQISVRVQVYEDVFQAFDVQLIDVHGRCTLICCLACSFVVSCLLLFNGSCTAPTRWRARRDRISVCTSSANLIPLQTLVHT